MCLSFARLTFDKNKCVKKDICFNDILLCPQTKFTKTTVVLVL